MWAVAAKGGVAAGAVQGGRHRSEAQSPVLVVLKKMPRLLLAPESFDSFSRPRAGLAAPIGAQLSEGAPIGAQLSEGAPIGAQLPEGGGRHL